MAYTLITSVGTGMYDGGYRETVYQFSGGKQFKTRLFLNAIFECRYRDINKLILIGTKTSSWDALIEDYEAGSATEKLWEKIYEATSSKAGITNEMATELESYLAEKYKLPVAIKFHTDKVDYETSEEIFTCYKDIAPELSNNDILFDITHGFRSMPILMYQTLQFVFANNPSRKIELVYGEYVKEEKISYVRNLSPYWELAQAADAISVFKTKLDGVKLSEMMQPYWVKGADVIKRISDTVQTNFCLQIIETIKNIKNALKTFPDNAPSWLGDVKHEIEELSALLDETSQSKTLYNYAKLLYEKHLNTQAIITMQVAVETAIAEKYGEKTPSGEAKNIGDYDWWQEEGRKNIYSKQPTKKQKGDKEWWNKIGKKLDNLQRFRNQIAHGGGKNRLGGFPKAENIPSIYESGKKGVEMLLEYLEKN